MPRFGDQIEKLLKQQDERIEKMQGEIEQTRRAASLRLPTMPPYSPVWQSADGKALIREMNEFGGREDVYAARLKTGSVSNAKFGEISAEKGVFAISPISGFFVSSLTARSIANNTETDIEFDAFTDNNQYFSNTDTNTNIKVASANRTLGIMGKLEWTTNGTGRRAVHLSLHNKSGAGLAGATLHSMLPTGIAEDTLPVLGVIFLGDYPTLDHVRVTVVQTSGGALNLNNAHIGLFLFI